MKSTTGSSATESKNMQELQKSEPGAATSTFVDESDTLAEANKLIGSGNKHMVLGDYPSAVNSFQEACHLLGKKYGETAEQCAEAYFLYGKALLELARMENGVLGNALEGVDVEDEADSSAPAEDAHIEGTDDLDDEKMEELREQVYDAMCEKEKPINGLPLEGKTSEATEDGEVFVEESKANDPAETELSTGPSLKQGAVQGISDVDMDSAVEKACAASISDPAVASEESKAVDLEEGKTNQAPVVEKSEETMAEDKNMSGAQSEVETGEDKITAINVDEVQEMESPVVEPSTVAETVTDTKVEEKETDSEHPKAEMQKESEADSAGEGKPLLPKHEKQDSNQLAAVETKVCAMGGEAKMCTDMSESGKPVADQDASGQSKKDPENIDVNKTAESQLEAEDQEAEGAKGEEAGEPMEEGEGEDDENEEVTAEEDKENEEEVGNLQLAWEMLDLAQVIYKRNTSKEAQLCAAQAHLKLGEIGIESGNYTQAVGDFLECLKIQQQHLDSCDRLLAESNYQLGLAYNYNSQYKEAVEHFNMSLDIIEKRLAMVSAKAEKEGSEDKEIEELKGLLPDIKEKIEDAKENVKSGPVTELALKQTLGSNSTDFLQQNGSLSTQASAIPVRKAPEGTTAKPVTDISHLVRKKRKPEEVSPQKNSDAKKPKQEATVNGSGDAVHNGNGVAETAEKLAETTDTEMAESTA